MDTRFGLRRLAVFAVVLVVVALPAATTDAPAATSARADDPAWLFDPLHVNEIDLDASGAALDSLRADPRSYVDAQITLHDSATRYGPYSVGLKLKGHSSFRDLDGKAAFRIKFGYSVAHQEFEGRRD